MEGTQMLALNKKCWDTVAPYFFQVNKLKQRIKRKSVGIQS